MLMERVEGFGEVASKRERKAGKEDGETNT